MPRFSQLTNGFDDLADRVGDESWLAWAGDWVPTLRQRLATSSPLASATAQTTPITPATRSLHSAALNALADPEEDKASSAEEDGVLSGGSYESWGGIIDDGDVAMAGAPETGGGAKRSQSDAEITSPGIRLHKTSKASAQDDDPRSTDTHWNDGFERPVRFDMPKMLPV